MTSSNHKIFFGLNNRGNKIEIAQRLINAAEASSILK
jgi:hypothetical protein